MFGRLMRGAVIHSARTVGGGAGSSVTAAQQQPLHMFPERRTGRCTRYRSAKRSAVMAARRARWPVRLTLAARNAARYSES